MTRDEAREAVKVLQHYADGGDVEYRTSLAEEWWSASTPVFDFTKRQYRIKPKPAEGWGTIVDRDHSSLIGWESEQEARTCVLAGCRVIHWREVAE